MKIYIASAFTERFWCQIVDQMLIEKGYTLTSEWYWTDGPTDEPRWAKLCQQHVEQADIFLLFVAGQSEGGRWTEMGMAIAQGKKIIIVGETKNIFQHLPNVTTCDTEGLLLVLEGLGK